MKILFCLLAALLLLYLWMILPRLRRPEEQLRELVKYRYAHRGLHGDGVPENSLPAFRLAAEYGFGVELDVHLTKDKRLVVVHDSNLKRLCGVDCQVEKLNWKELQRLRLLGSDERIPLLDEVLPILCGRSPVIVEIKVEGNISELCSLLCERMKRYEGLYCLECFDPRAVMWLKKNEPELVRGQLAENFIAHPGQVKLSLALRVALTALITNVLSRPDFIAFKFEDRRGNPGLWLCKNVFRAPVICWTITSQKDLEQSEKEGCSAIFEGFMPEGRMA